MKNVNQRRKEEGVCLAAISNKKLDYRAEILNKTSNKKDKHGKKPNLSIGNKHLARNKEPPTNNKTRKKAPRKRNPTGGDKSPRKPQRSAYSSPNPSTIRKDRRQATQINNLSIHPTKNSQVTLNPSDVTSLRDTNPRAQPLNYTQRNKTTAPNQQKQSKVFITNKFRKPLPSKNTLNTKDLPQRNNSKKKQIRVAARGHATRSNSPLGGGLGTGIT